MKKIRFFKCPNNHISEHFVIDGVKVVECECGKGAHVMLSAPKCFGNTTGKSPSTSNRK